MDWSELAARPPAWGGGATGLPDAGTFPADPILGAILLTRVLAFRNFAGQPFVVSAPPKACAFIADQALRFIAKHGGRSVWRLADCPPRAIRLLREREILPLRAAAFPGKQGFKYLAAAPDGAAWTLVNEVEHVTLGRVLPGCSSAAAVDAVLADGEGSIAPEEGAAFPWSWSPGFGYLASDPARSGPALSLEWVVHLPALALSRRLPQVRNYLAAAGVGFLPVSAPSPQAASPGAADAGLFRVIGRARLGESARDFCASFATAVEPVLRHEYEMKGKYAEKHRKRLEDRARQSLRSLSSATVLTHAAFLALGSQARLGADLGMLDPRIPRILEELRIATGSGHLSVSSGRELTKEEEDFTRANVVRSYLEETGGEIH